MPPLTHSRSGLFVNNRAGMTVFGWGDIVMRHGRFLLESAVWGRGVWSTAARFCYQTGCFRLGLVCQRGLRHLAHFLGKRSKRWTHSYPQRWQRLTVTFSILVIIPFNGNAVKLLCVTH